LSVEYPGYGLYLGVPSEEEILKDSELVYDYLTEVLGVKEENIILMGKSLGSGPATHLASHRRPSSLILITPYTSIMECAVDLLGRFCRYLVNDRFRNIDQINKVLFFILD
jgi:abhydrolase domain-containing protein 17